MKDNIPLVKSALAELVVTVFMTLSALISGKPYVVVVILVVFLYAIV